MRIPLLTRLLATCTALAVGCGSGDSSTPQQQEGRFVEPQPQQGDTLIPEQADSVPAIEEPPTPTSLLVVFDGSGSMGAEREGRVKLEIARAAFVELVRELPGAVVSAGLIAYGHRREGDCNDIELIIPPEPLDRMHLADGLATIRARGMTPIAGALEAAADALTAAEGERAIVLLTDGEDTCGGDPSAVAQRLRDELGIRIHIVGFDIMEPDAAIELRRMAEAGDGGYFTAATVEGLNDMITRVAAAIETGEVLLDQTVQENIHIVLDRSLDMSREYDDGGRKTTRLALAQAALSEVLDGLAADRDNMAYRHFGGSCDGTGSELMVPFGLNRGPEIRARLEFTEPRGERTLVDAVIEAAYDFDRFDIPTGVNKRVVIITGGTDPCFRLESTAVIQQRLENRDIRPDYHFIGVGVTAGQIAELQQMAQELDGTLSAVLTQAQLEGELERVIETFPAIRSLEQVIAVVNSGQALLEDAMSRLGRADYSGATATARSASDLSSTRLPFRDLARRRTRDEFRQFFDIARELRELQAQQVPVVLSMVEALEQDDIETYERLADGQQEIVERYNELVDRANALLEAMRQS